MNFVLNNGPEMALLNHPLFIEVNRLFPSTNTSFEDALKGRSLKDVESGATSHTDYIVGNMFKKVRNDLGLNPTLRLKQETIEGISRNNKWDMKLKVILDNVENGSKLSRVLLKARDICHSLFCDFSPWDINPRITFGATEVLPKGDSVIARLRSADSTSLDSLLSLPDGHALKAYYLYKVGAVDLRLERQIYSPLTKKWENIPNGIQDGSYVLFASVGKTARIDRPVGFHEPLQLAVQCGIGDFHETVLRRVDIDITTAQAKHRHLVELYSMFPGTLATLDQSNASQNILRRLVEFLYPRDLFSLMDAVTPRVIRIDGKDYHLEMMSAQGNGYNTGMQTVVYYALLSAIAYVKGISTKVWQYGDDSIFNADLFEPACIVLETLGFEINREKSFSTHVLESCGMDADAGINIRPYYVKNLPNTSREWYHVCNGIYRVGYANNSNTWRCSNFKRLWLWCIANIQPSDRFFGPVEYGDDVLHTENCSKYYYTKAGTKIRAFGTSNNSGKRIFQVANGLPGQNVFSLLVHPTLRGSGYRYSKSMGYYYPQVVGPRDTIYGTQSLPFPVPLIQDHDDIDVIFSTLKLSSDEMLQRYQSKLHANRYKLILALKRFAKKRMDIESEVKLDVVF